jgi:hypothetical protein
MVRLFKKHMLPNGTGFCKSLCLWTYSHRLPYIASDMALSMSAIYYLYCTVTRLDVLASRHPIKLIP